MTRTLSSTAPPESVTGNGMRVARRNGSVAGFDAGRIAVAITKAFLAVQGDSAGRSSRLRSEVTEMTDAVTTTLLRRYGASGRPVDLEEVQDQVELALMRGGHAPVARAYILYREEHRKARADRETGTSTPAVHSITVLAADGSRTPLDDARLRRIIGEACANLPEVDETAVLNGTRTALYDGISAKELGLAPIMAARVLVETEPAYSQVAARLLADTLRHEALSHLAGHPEAPTAAEMNDRYPGYFARLHRPRNRAGPT